MIGKLKNITIEKALSRTYKPIMHVNKDGYVFGTIRVPRVLVNKKLKIILA